MPDKLIQEIIRLQIFRDLLLNTTKKFIDVSSDELDDLLNGILKDVGEFFDCDRSYIFLFDWEKETMDNTHEWCAEGVTPEINNLQKIPFEILPVWMQELSADQNIHIPIVSELPEDWQSVKEILEPQGIQSLIVVPIIFNKKVLGFNGFDSVRRQRTWQQEEISLLRILANNIASAVQRRATDIELLNAKKSAETANRAKSEFLANMSHEIRTPLNGVIGFTELLLSTKVDDSQKLYLENAYTSAQTLLSLLNDILDFSKIEAGKLELDYVQSDLIEIVEQTVDVVKLQASKKGLELLLSIQPGIPRYILADPVRLRQILINILSNAVKFTNKGEVELILKFETVQKEGEEKRCRFFFEIRDTGIGISETDVAKLFQAFSQADASTTRKFGGTGLGLVITSKLLEKMGSVLNLSSKVGKGSLFYFEIILSYSDDEEIVDVPKVINSPLIEHRGKSANILLIAEDNEFNLLLAKTIIQKNFPNFSILEAKNGTEAIEIFKRDNPDIILMDLQMPETDGYQATAQIRELESKTDKRIPIIALTAGALEGEREKCLAFGMDDFLTKPIKQDIFLGTIRSYLPPDL